MESNSFKAAIRAMDPRKYVTPVAVRFMCVSTAHITKQDNDAMSKNRAVDACGDLNFDRFEYGYYVFVPDQNDTDELPVSDTFKTLLHYARANGFMYIKLDCDGTVYPQLEVCDW